MLILSSLANEVRISTKRRYPSLSEGTLLLSKYVQEGSALIQDIIPSHRQPGFIFHMLSTTSRPRGFCAVLEDCIATQEDGRRKKKREAIMEAILQCLKELVIHHPAAASRTVPEMKTFSCTSEVVISLFAQRSPGVGHY